MRQLHRVAFAFALLVNIAARAAIPVADDAYTEHDYRKALLAFNRRTLVDVYEKSGKKDPKWDGAAKAFLEGVAIRASNAAAEPLYRLSGEPPYAKLKALEDAAINAGCDDPLVLYCRIIRMQEDGRPASEMLPILEQVVTQLNAESAAEPSWRGVWAQHRLCQLTDPKDAAARANEWDRFKDVAVDFITRWKCQDVDARIIYQNLWEILEAQGPDYQQAFAKALRAKPGGDAWLREMLLGSADIKAAWHFRGGGWANTVTDGGWAGFNRHLAQARDHLTEAHKLQPKFPEAAAEMITVAMGAGTELNEDERAWFNQAVAAQFDYGPAYYSYIWASRPRWGGTIGRMYDFGLECAQTKRYDTRVPRFLLRALDEIAAEMNGPQFWRQPGVYDEVKSLYDGLAAHAQTKRNKPTEADAVRSEQAAFAWRAQNYEEAKRLLDALGDRVDYAAFEKYNAMGRLAASHVYAMQTPWKTFVDTAEQVAGINDVAAAIAVYDSCIDDVANDDKALFFLKSRRQQLQWQKQYDAGAWVHIQPAKDLIGWNPQAGKWDVDESGGVVGTFVKRELCWLPCQGQFVRGSFVIEGNVELLDDKNCSAGVGMTYNKLDQIYGFFLQRDVRGGKSYFRRDFYPGSRDAMELQPKNKFRFTFAAGRAAATVNDTEIFRDYDVSYLWKANKSYLGIGGRWGEPGSRMRFTNLRIRSTNAAAPDDQNGNEKR